MKTKRPMKLNNSGRKKSGKAVRTAKVQFCLTPEDAEWFNDFAADCGFVSRSQLITALMERLRLCRFSPIGTLRVSLQIREKLDANLKNTGKKRPASLDWDSILLRPLPPLPEDAPYDETVLEALEENLNQTEKDKEIC